MWSMSNSKQTILLAGVYVHLPDSAAKVTTGIKYFQWDIKCSEDASGGGNEHINI